MLLLGPRGVMSLAPLEESRGGGGGAHLRSEPKLGSVPGIGDGVRGRTGRGQRLARGVLTGIWGAVQLFAWFLLLWLVIRYGYHSINV